MTTRASSLVRAAWLCTVVLLGACASHAANREDTLVPDPPQVDAFLTYAAATLHLPESHIDGGPATEAEAAMVPERVGTIWAMMMFHAFEPEVEVRGWATADGTVITLDQHLGVLLDAAGVWGNGLSPGLTAMQIANRLVWSLGKDHQVWFDPAIGVPAPEIALRDGAGTLELVDDFAAGGRPHVRTRLDIALTADHGATVTRSSWLPPSAP